MTPDDAQKLVTFPGCATTFGWEDVRKRIEQDNLLQAVELARNSAVLTPEQRAEVERLAAHAASPDAYRTHYREVMQGDPCPEGDLFTRHLLVKRFAGIRERVLARKQMRVLDLGCLDGWCLLNLAAGGITGVGVDLNPQALKVAEDRTAKYGFHLLFLESSIEDFDIIHLAPEGFATFQFDAVLLSEVLEHVLDPVACFRTAFRHLAPGGVVYTSTPATPIPHHGKIADAVLHLRVFTDEALRKAAREAGLAAVVDHEVIEQDDQGQRFAQRLMSFRRARVAIYTNHITGGWDPTDLGSLNASEEMVVRTAEAWVGAGHDVLVFQNTAKPEWAASSELAQTHNRVSYKPREAPLPDNLDVLVLFKALDHNDHPARAKVFWTCDLPEHQGGGAAFLPPLVADRLDRVVCISEWHRQKVIDACPWVPPDKVVAHWVGVDPAEIAAARHAVPAPTRHRVVYASSPDRGLRNLLLAWPRVLERLPQAELEVLYGFDFWKRSEAVLQEPVRSQMIAARQELERLLQQPGVRFVGRLANRAKYLQHLAAAEVWAYPCTGGELCCKVALEAQALGVIPVVWPTMALQETVVDARFHVPGSDLNVFADRVAGALTHAETAREMLAETASRISSWQQLADFVWRQVAEKLEAPIQPAAAVPKPAEEAKPDLPERFAIPRPHKIGRHKLDLLMHVNGMPFDGQTDRVKSLGGSETAALQLSRVLANRGHHVTIFSNCEQPGKFDGVTYIPLGEYPRYVGCTSHDVCVVQRDPIPFNMPTASKLNVLWMHDLGLHRHGARVRSSLWNVDYIIPVSHWHGRQLCRVYGLEPDVVAPMRNGIERDRVRPKGLHEGPKNRKALVWAARPERGLDLLLERVFPKLLERDPDLVLHLAGYENTVPEMQAFYQHCWALAAGYGERVKRVGALTKDQLYQLYRTSRAYIYCTKSFEEVACISLMECAAAGLPFVGSAWGALPETAGYCEGVTRLVSHPGNPTDQYVKDFIEAAWEVISDDLVNARMSQAGIRGAKAYDWDGIAREWEDFLLGAIEQRSADPIRLTRHCWRIGDTQFAKYLLADEEVVENFPLTLDLEEAREELFDPDAPMPQDEPASDVPSSVMNALANAVAQGKPASLKPLAPQSVGIAQQLAGAMGLRYLAPDDPEPADVVLGVETLDCAAEPDQHIREAERAVKQGGAVCLVVAGPAVQRHRLHSGTPRRGRWVFDQHDIRELLSGKRDLLALVVGGGSASAYDGTPLSWSVYAWRQGSGPTGKLDLKRRRELQGPRQSLTAALITYNSEGMLIRCLKSIQPYVDEIVVNDNGSTDGTLDILAQFGARVFPGLDPRTHGFDASRNAGLPHFTGDFVLWIDTDEELVDGFGLPKYLRWNMFNGYAIQQHHFSANPPNAFKPDLPVRVFRRVGLDGKPTGIRWFGIVHEHPELAVNASVGESVCLSDVNIAHVGYLSESVRRRRFDRNIQLMFRDRAMYPDRLLGQLLMIRDYAHLARYAVQGGGGMTRESAEFYEKVVSEYRQAFLGRAHSMALDGLQYYNEALIALGRGFEVNLVLQVGWIEGGSRDVNYHGRVADLADLQTLLAGCAKDLGGIWSEKYL